MRNTYPKLCTLILYVSMLLCACVYLKLYSLDKLGRNDIRKEMLFYEFYFVLDDFLFKFSFSHMKKIQVP
jgi:hypothetical protein